MLGYQITRNLLYLCTFMSKHAHISTEGVGNDSFWHTYSLQRLWKASNYELFKHTSNFIHFVVLINYGFIIMWRIYSTQELLSHRNLKTGTQQQNYGLDQSIARQQLCEGLDCATVSSGHATSVFLQMSHTRNAWHQQQWETMFS
jgi:hypothetical protein